MSRKVEEEEVKKKKDEKKESKGGRTRRGIQSQKKQLKETNKEVSLNTSTTSPLLPASANLC